MDRAQYDASMNLSVESKHQLDISARVSMHSPPKTRPRPVANTATLDFSMGDDLYGYIAPPGTITPHRDVLRWVQSLDLAHSLKDCRR